VPLHANHLHLDLAHHDAKGKSRYCKPTPVYPADVPMAYARGTEITGSIPAAIAAHSAAHDDHDHDDH
jgi:hypothetical protein